MRSRAAIGVLIGASVALFGLGAGLATAQSPEEDREHVQRELSDLAAQIRSQRGDRSELQDQILATEARMAELQAELDEVEQRRVSVLGSIDATVEELTGLEAGILGLQAELAELAVSAERERALVRDRAVEMYMVGSDSVGQLVFDSAGVTSLSIGLEYAGNVVADSDELLNDLAVLERRDRAARDELARQEEEAAALLAELEVRRADVEAEEGRLAELRVDVESELATQQELLVSVNRRIAEYQSEQTLKQDELDRLDRLIASLNNEGDSPGTLAYPVSGPISSPFGFRLHPILGVRRLHAGIDFNAPSGAPIWAAESGRIVHAGIFGGYGNTVLIDHGGGLTTLYAHMSSVSVSSGQRVARGDVIGHVGSTGFSTGPHLHFETREFGDAVDPIPYLG